MRRRRAKASVNYWTEDRRREHKHEHYIEHGVVEQRLTSFRRS
jgi:hypothetical protein